MIAKPGPAPPPQPPAATGAASAREAEERLRLTLDASRCELWEWDVERDRIEWPQRVNEFFGLPPGTFGGRLADLEALLHPRDRKGVMAALARTLDQGSVFRQEFRIGRPNRK